MEAQDLFSKTYPEEEFLPHAPDPKGVVMEEVSNRGEAADGQAGDGESSAKEETLESSAKEEAVKLVEKAESRSDGVEPNVSSETCSGEQNNELDDVYFNNVGQIISMTVENFMCHTHTQLDFNPFLNIILGKNGSGKSALLLALQVALGAKDTSGKTLNMKNVVQRGKSFSLIAVTLGNEGRTGYKPEIYGSSVTITTKITRKGVSTYSIKNYKGDVVSKKIEVLNAILTAFNIQVRNPIQILTQNMSRCIMDFKNSKDKYSIYSRGIQLDQLEEEFKTAMDHINSTKQRVMLLKNELDILSNNLQDKRKNVKEYEGLPEMKNSFCELYVEFCWAKVIEQEKLIVQLNNMKVMELNRANEAKRKLLESQGELNDVATKKQTMSEELKELRDKISHDNLAIQLYKEDEHRMKSQLQETQTKHTQLLRTMEEHRKVTNSLESKIESIGESTYESVIEEKMMKTLNRVKNCKELIKSHEEVQLQQNDELKCTNSDIAKLQIECFNIIDKQQMIQQKRSLLDEKIKSCEAIKVNQISAYGRYTPMLLDKLRIAAQSNVFDRPPIGPIGLHIKVKDKKWALATECCLGEKFLNSYICFSIEDEQLLYKIMEEVMPNQPTPQVIVRSYFPERYCPDKVDPILYFCALDMVVVDDESIYNVLIDEKGLESTLLVPEEDLARKIMMSDPPQNVTCIYTVKGDVVYPYPQFHFYGQTKKTAHMIFHEQNLEEIIKLKSTEISNLQVAEKESSKAFSELQTTISQMEDRSRCIQKNVASMNSKINDLLFEIERLENSEPEDNLSALKQDLRNRKLEYEQLRIDKENLSQILALLDGDHKAVLDKIKLTEEGMEDVETRFDDITLKEIAVCLKEMEKIKEIADNHKEYEKYCKSVNVVNERLKCAQLVCQEMQQKAGKMTTKVDTDRVQIDSKRDPCIIKAKCDELKRIIDEIEKRVSNVDELVENCNKQAAQQESMSKFIKETDAIIKVLSDNLRKRRVWINSANKSYSSRVNNCFHNILKNNGYNGNIKFDHEQKTLTVEASIIGHETSPSHYKNLSGGEKSFINFSIILALWEITESPFKILDEYDAFMDQVNRKKAMELMTQNTKLYHNQLIYFSPQKFLNVSNELSFLNDREISVIVLDDPKKT